MASLGHPYKFQRVLRLGSVSARHRVVGGSITARHSSRGRQPNFAALNRGRHLCSAGRPSGWALAHILVRDCTPPKKYSICRVFEKCRLLVWVRLPNEPSFVSLALFQTFGIRLLWSPYVIGQTIIFSSCFFFLLLLLLLSFFPRLISAVGDWMFTILWHMVWP